MPKGVSFDKGKESRNSSAYRNELGGRASESVQKMKGKNDANKDYQLNL